MREDLAYYMATAEQPFTFPDDIRYEYFMKTCVQIEWGCVSKTTTNVT